MAWLRDGLMPPRVVKEATETYFSAEDELGEWVEECCEVGPDEKGSVTSLFNSYKAFCEERNQPPLGRKRFGNELEKRRFRRGQDSNRNRTRIHQGVALRG